MALFDICFLHWLRLKIHLSKCNDSCRERTSSKTTHWWSRSHWAVVLKRRKQDSIINFKRGIYNKWSPLPVAWDRGGSPSHEGIDKRPSDTWICVSWFPCNLYYFYQSVLGVMRPTVWALNTALLWTSRMKISPRRPPTALELAIARPLRLG